MPATCPPVDTAALHALVVTQQSQLAARDAEIEHLKLVIAKLQRMQFGCRSEQRHAVLSQLELALEECEVTQAERASDPDVVPKKRAARKTRRPLPPHLPRETVIHATGHTCCPDCGGRLRLLGEDVAEMLEYVPAHFKVIRHIRPKLACASCDSILQAPAPSRPIARGMAGAGLLAHVLVSKYCDHRVLRTRPLKL